MRKSKKWVCEIEKNSSRSSGPIRSLSKTKPMHRFDALCFLLAHSLTFVRASTERQIACHAIVSLMFSGPELEEAASLNAIQQHCRISTSVWQWCHQHLSHLGRSAADHRRNAITHAARSASKQFKQTDWYDCQRSSTAVCSPLISDDSPANLYPAICWARSLYQLFQQSEHTEVSSIACGLWHAWEERQSLLNKAIRNILRTIQTCYSETRTLHTWSTTIIRRPIWFSVSQDTTILPIWLCRLFVECYNEV